MHDVVDGCFATTVVHFLKYISCGLCTPGSLPQGMTADGLYASRMDELAESVVELGRSTPVDFGWGSECDMYNLDSQQPASDSNESQETETNAPGAGSGSGGARTSRAQGRRPDAPVFNVEVGEFVAMPTPPTVKESVMVGKVVAIEKYDGGDELELRWYMPAQTRSNLRSDYGRGAWTPEFIKAPDGKLVPSMGQENVRSVCSKFASLQSTRHLPSHVWKSVAESTLPIEESSEGTEGEARSLEGEERSSEGEQGNASSSASLELQQQLSTSISGQTPQSPRPEMLANESGGGGGVSGKRSQASVAPSSGNDEERPSKVRLTAAAYRTRRGDNTR